MHVETLWLYDVKAPMAQWIARLTSNQAVAGSNPAGCVRDVRHRATIALTFWHYQNIGDTKIIKGVDKN